LILAIVVAWLPGETWSRTLDMDQFVSLVRQHSKDLQIASKDREEADAQKSQAVALALPHVGAQAGYTRNLSDLYMYLDMSSLTGEEDAGITKSVSSRNNEFSAAVSLTQTLFSGTVMNAITAARQYRRLTDFAYDATFQQIVTLSKQAFAQTLLLRKVLEVSEQSEQNALDNYNDTKSRFDNGLASEFELLQAESRYRETVPQTASARRNLELALVDLKNLAGISVDEELSLTGSLETYPEMPGPISLDQALDTRPDYNALVWEERLRRTAVSAERAGYFPSLAAVAAYGYSAQSNDFKLEEENNAWTIGLQLSIPIFQGGDTRAKVRQASIQLDKSQLELAKSRDQIEKDLRSVRLRLEEAHARIASAQAALETATKAHNIAESTTRVGLTTQLELKDTRVVLDQASVAYYTAVFEYLAAWYDWQMVSGALTDDESK